MLNKFLCAVGGLVISSFLAGPAAADKIKIDFWYGNSGDISKRVQEVCQHFNESQTEYEAVCTSQGSYYAAVQNTIAAFRGGKPPTIVQVFDVGTLDLMLGRLLPRQQADGRQRLPGRLEQLLSGNSRLLRDLEG